MKIEPNRLGARVGCLHTPLPPLLPGMVPGPDTKVYTTPPRYTTTARFLLTRLVDRQHGCHVRYLHHREPCREVAGDGLHRVARDLVQLE